MNFTSAPFDLYAPFEEMGSIRLNKVPSTASGIDNFNDRRFCELDACIQSMIYEQELNYFVPPSWLELTSATGCSSVSDSFLPPCLPPSAFHPVNNDLHNHWQPPPTLVLQQSLHHHSSSPLKSTVRSTQPIPPSDFESPLSFSPSITTTSQPASPSPEPTSDALVASQLATILASNYLDEQVKQLKKTIDGLPEGVLPRNELFVPFFRNKHGNHLCMICGKLLVNRTQMVQHIMGHHCGLRPFECEFCELRSIRKADIRKHIKEKHTAQEKYPCPKCTKTYLNQRNLRRHQKLCRASRDSRAKASSYGSTSKDTPRKPHCLDGST